MKHHEEENRRIDKYIELLDLCIGNIVFTHFATTILFEFIYVFQRYPMFYNSSHFIILHHVKMTVDLIIRYMDSKYTSTIG